MMRICGIAIIGGIACFIIGESNRSAGQAVCCAAFILIFGYAVSSLTDITGAVAELTDACGFTEYASLLLRATGIVFAAETASETCRALGADACAAGIDLACRAELLLLVFPVFERLFSLSVSLL